MNKNETFAVYTSIATVCAGIAIFEKNRMDRAQRIRLEENQLLLTCINNMERFTDRKPKHITYHTIAKKIENGDYLRNATTMLDDYIEQYELEQIANPII
jgi:hypothetical protein